jgi:hypothetical protein
MGPSARGKNGHQKARGRTLAARGAFAAAAALLLAGLAVPPLFLWYYEGPRTHRGEDGLLYTYMMHGGEKSIEVSGVSTDTDPTHSQVQAAAELLRETHEQAAANQDYDRAASTGGFTVSNAAILDRPDARFVHLWNPSNMQDDAILDPARPESLIFNNTEHGMHLVGVMYVAPPGTHGPQPGGALTRWHFHPVVEFCMDEFGVPVTKAENGTDGGCPPGMVHGPTPEMLHVWLVDNPNGAFSHMMALDHDHHEGTTEDEDNVYEEFLRRTVLWVRDRF